MNPGGRIEDLKISIFILSFLLLSAIPSCRAERKGSKSQDFKTRCSDPNVVRCYGFDVLPLLVNSASPGPGISPAADGSYHAGIDHDIYASGGGSLRFDIPPNSNANVAGDFHMDFSDDYSVQFGNGSKYGNEFYVQWRQRFDAAYLKLNASAAGGGGMKQIIIGLGDANGLHSRYIAGSCTDFHLVLTDPQYNNVPRIYHNCGTKVLADYVGYQGLEPEVPSTSDWEFQDAVGCLRSEIVSGKPGKCLHRYPDEWMTFQIHVKAGKDYSPFAESSRGEGGNADSRNYHHDSTVELWVAREGQPSRLILSMTDFDLVQHDISGGTQSFRWWQENHVIPRYGKVWLLPYDTGRTTKASFPAAKTWYDDVIISRRRVPDPDVATPNPPDDLTVINTGSANVLKWRDNSDVKGSQPASGFVIEGCAGYTYADCYADPPKFKVLARLPRVTTWTDKSKASAASPYTYRVKAVNSAGASAYSNASMNVPGAVADVRAAPVSPHSVLITWTQSDPQPLAIDARAHYVVERCSGSYIYCSMQDSKYEVVVACTAIRPGLLQCVDRSVLPGNTYTYRVKSVNAAGSYVSWGEIYRWTVNGGASTISEVHTPSK